MLKRDTILRKLPKALDPKQALFLDGIRHASDIASFAYSRLKHTLTEIALQDLEESRKEHQMTSAFLDAWSVVDAIDRLRGLFILFPGAKKLEGDSEKISFGKVTKPIRDLRNVADHLAERSEYVLAQNATALGTIAWCTALPDGSHPNANLVSCALVPGTIKTATRSMINPAGRAFELPTGLVTLSAGEYSADLSDTMIQMGKFLEDIEKQIEKSLHESGKNLESSGSDFTVKVYMSFGDSGAPTQTAAPKQ